MSAQPMKIYGVPISVHTRKVILAAKLKAIAYEVVPIVPVIPDELPRDWRSTSPTGLIPAIDDNGYILADSTAIVLYLEKRLPTPALLPKNDRDYGTALFLDSWAGGVFRQIIHPIFHNQVVKPNLRKQPCDADAIKAALQEAERAFTYLEGSSRGGFLIGGALSIADLAVVSNLLMFHYLGHRLTQERFPRVHQYFREHLASPLWQTTLEEEKPFAERMGLDRGFL